MVKKTTEEREEQSAVSQVQPEPLPTHDTRVAKGKRPRVSGALAKPIYLIHDGNFTATIPAVTREIVVDDPDAEKFAHLREGDEVLESGDVFEEVVIPEYEITGKLPADSRFGSRKIGVAHAITDKAEADALKDRGFREATAAEIEKSGKLGRGAKTVDEIAAEQRVKAQENLRRMSRGSGFRRESE